MQSRVFTSFRNRFSLSSLSPIKNRFTYRRNITHSRIDSLPKQEKETSYLGQYTEKINLENFDYLQDTFFQRLRADRREQIIFWCSVVLCFGTSVIVFSDGIIGFFSKKSAKLASQTLKDQELKHSTDVMIEEILSSEQNQARVAELLVNVIQTDGVYYAVLDLLLKLGKDPKFIDQLAKVLSTAVQNVINDPKRYQQLIDLIVKLVNDPATSEQIIKVLKKIAMDPEMQVATGNHINVALKCALLWGYAKSIEKEVSRKTPAMVEINPTMNSTMDPGT